MKLSASRGAAHNAAGNVTRTHERRLASVVAGAEFKARKSTSKHSVKSIHKAKMSAAKYGLVSNIAGADYPIPPKTIAALFKAVERGDLPAGAFMSAIKTIMYISKQGEVRQRGGYDKPIRVGHSLWITMRDKVLNARLI